MSKSNLFRLSLSLVCTTILSFSNTYAGVIYETHFQGEEKEVGVVLKWSTSSEENNSIFIIEKAEDGEDFKNIGAVGGAGTVEELTEYNFFDLNIHGTYILYRLKQIDVDGTESYSKSLFINKVNENNFMVAKMSEVMTSDEFEVTFDMLINSYVEYELKNAKGETVLIERVQANKGINDIVIDVSEAAIGTYKLVLKVKEEEEVLTFRKIKSDKQKNKTVTAKKD